MFARSSSLSDELSRRRHRVADGAAPRSRPPVLGEGGGGASGIGFIGGEEPGLAIGTAPRGAGRLRWAVIIFAGVDGPPSNVDSESAVPEQRRGNWGGCRGGFTESAVPERTAILLLS